MARKRIRRATSSPLVWIAFAALASSAGSGGCGGSVSTSSSSHDDGGSPAASSASSGGGVDPSQTVHVGGSSGGSSSTSSASGGSSGSGGSGTSGSGDATAPAAAWGAIPPEDLGPGVSLSLSTFTVPPGGEDDLCQVFANPFGGKDADVLQVTGTVGGGSDRFEVFVIDSSIAATEPAIGTIGDCAGHGLEFHPVLMLSQQPQQTTRYPTAADGTPMGYRLSGSNLLMVYTHYLNSGSTAIGTSATVTLTPAKAGVVTTHVGNLLLQQVTFSVPANTPRTSPYDASVTMNGDSTLPGSYAIVGSQGYLGTSGLSLTASAGGNVFYRQSTSARPGIFLHVAGAPEPSGSTGQASPVVLSNASPLTWDCAEYNTSAMAISAGDSSKSNAWCMYVAQYYPADPANADRLFIK